MTLDTFVALATGVVRTDLFAAGQALGVLGIVVASLRGARRLARHRLWVNLTLDNRHDAYRHLLLWMENAGILSRATHVRITNARRADGTTGVAPPSGGTGSSRTDGSPFSTARSTRRPGSAAATTSARWRRSLCQSCSGAFWRSPAGSRPAARSRRDGTASALVCTSTRGIGGPRSATFRAARSIRFWWMAAGSTTSSPIWLVLGRPRLVRRPRGALAARLSLSRPTWHRKIQADPRARFGARPRHRQPRCRAVHPNRRRPARIDDRRARQGARRHRGCRCRFHPAWPW